MLWWTLQQLKSKDDKTRLQAVGKLAEQEGANIIDALLAALTDTNKEVRRTAAKLLGKFKDPKAVRPLISALSDRDTEMRENVAEALKELGDASAVPSLIRFLKDSEPGVRWHASSALEVLGWKPNGDAELALLQVAQGKADRCVAYGEAAIDALGLMLRGGQFFKRQQAVEALSRIGGSKVVKPLVDALRDEDAIVRNAAVEALTKVGDARAIDPLLRGLRDKDNRVRATIVDALSKFGDARAIDPLAKLLKDECWDVRMAAIEAMGKFKEPRAIDPLVVCLKDKDRDARQAAVMSLGRIGDPRAVESLVVALTDENDGVRAAAAAALRRLDKNWEHSEGARRAVPALQQLAKSNDYWIRQTAADTLEKIGELKQTAPQDLKTFADPVLMRKQAASEALVSALADSDRDLRQAAAESLGRMGDPHATPALVTALGDYDEWVRRSAAKALEILNWTPPDSAQKAKWMVNLQKWEESVRLGPAAVEPLVTALRAKTSSVREEAAKALGRIGDTRAITPLVACVKDNFNFPGVRTAAAVSLVALKWQPDTPEMVALHALETADWEKVAQLGNTVLSMLLEYLRDSRVDDDRYEGALGALSRINDPHAVGMLALHAEDAELARPILTALEQILAFKAGDISEDDLRQIVSIRNPTTTTYHVDPTTGEYTPEQNETVDFGLPRQLAEQELSVRVMR